MIEIDIRYATKKDLESILDIYNDAILNSTAVYDYEPHTIAMREKWFEEKQHHQFPVLVACMDLKVVGFASYGSFRPWAAYQFSMEHSVYVHPDYRRLGIANRLLSQLIDSAKENGVKTLIAGIDANNDSSIKLHQQFGFFEAGNLKKVGFKFNKWLDLIFYQLILDEHTD